MTVYLHHPKIFWNGSTAGHEQTRRFLECINDNFLTQGIEEPALLDLISTDKEEPI